MLSLIGIMLILAAVVFLVVAITLIARYTATSSENSKSKGPRGGAESSSESSSGSSSGSSPTGSRRGDSIMSKSLVPLERWEGVREAVQTCHPGVGKFTVSFVPPGVWAGGRVNGYTLTGSYDAKGNKILTEPFGNSNERRYDATTCDDRTSYSGVNCQDGIVIEDGQARIDATGENTCTTGCETAEDWIHEIGVACRWWEDCFSRSTGADIKLEIIGWERFVDGGLPEFGRDKLSQEEMDRHNIGDIRIGAYDFNKEGCELSGVLQYAYAHTPNDFSRSRGYVAPGNATGFHGNLCRLIGLFAGELPL